MASQSDEKDKSFHAVAGAVSALVKELGTSRTVFPYPSLSHLLHISESSGVPPRLVGRHIIQLRNEGCRPKFVYAVFHKPTGFATHRNLDAKEGTNVYHALPGWVPPIPHVGRLDKQTSGLLLFTDDGLLADAIMNGTDSRRKPITKEYECLVRVPAPRPGIEVSGVDIEGLRPEGTGVTERHKEMLLSPPDGTMCALSVDVLPVPGSMGDGGGDTVPAASSSQRAPSAIVRVVVDEGKKHQVRRMIARAGLQLKTLHRRRLGSLTLEGLGCGEARSLTQEEVRNLYDAALPGSPVPDVIGHAEMVGETSPRG